MTAISTRDSRRLLLDEDTGIERFDCGFNPVDPAGAERFDRLETAQVPVVGMHPDADRFRSFQTFAQALGERIERIEAAMFVRDRTRAR